MKSAIEFLRTFSAKPSFILDLAIPIARYTSIDFSTGNLRLNNLSITNPTDCQAYVDEVLCEKGALVAYGGYLESRNLYNDNANFSDAEGKIRNIHLGMDFWSQAGTQIVLPIEGTVHSFQNNTMKGDYGPTLILAHELDGYHFHTLYGHLSLESLENLYVGMPFRQGDSLATLGTPEVNGNYAPHLHFQIIIDMEDKKGDYPGVCAAADIGFYAQNCPDPNLILGLK